MSFQPRDVPLPMLFTSILSNHVCAALNWQSLKTFGASRCHQTTGWELVRSLLPRRHLLEIGDLHLFPSRQKGKHITGGLVNKQWVRTRKKAGLPTDLVLYCARHDFGTYVLQKTGHIAAVMNSMGHSDVKTAMTYQHPELDVVRDAINSRHILRHTAETVN